MVAILPQIGLGGKPPLRQTARRRRLTDNLLRWGERERPGLYKEYEPFYAVRAIGEQLKERDSRPWLTKYAFFDIKIEATGTDYEYIVKVVNSPIDKHPSETFDLAQIGQQSENIKDDSAKMKKVGQLLFQDAIFKGEILECYRESLDRAESHSQRLCVKLFLESSPLESSPLAAQPWEFMYDSESAGGRFLCCSPKTPIVRASVPSIQIREQLDKRKRPLKMLIVSANPLPTLKLNLDNEVAEIKKMLGNHVKIKTVSDKDPTWQCMLDRIDNDKFDIVHLTMHGVPGELSATGKRGIRETLTGDDISTLFESISPLLVFVNACSAGEPDEKREESSILLRLSQKRIPFVVGMQYEISDTAAETFSRNFYRHLAEGDTILDALTRARLRVHKCYRQDEPDSVEWGKPVLYMNGENIPLFPRGNSAN